MTKAPQVALRGIVLEGDLGVAALLRAPLLGFVVRGFLGLGEEVDLLGDDLAAVTVGAVLVGPF